MKAPKHHLLLPVLVTLLLVASCRPSDPPGQATESASPGAASDWRTTKSGSFDSSNFFFSQFGAAPFDIAVAGNIAPAKPGTRIRYRIYSQDRKNVIFTAMMEKQTERTDTREGLWIFSAQDGNGNPVPADDSCLSCHRQQAANDYLFTLPGKASK